ncbi:MAG: response regulator [Pirellulales bacterium]
MSPRLKILFVDDEETFLRSTCELLNRAQYDCDCTQSVEEAGTWLDERDYDLAIVDINMPGNADLEFVRQLSGRAEGPPVILVTAYPSINSAIRSVELPVVAYMVKPFDFEDLLSKVQAAARRAEVLRAVRGELERLKEYRQSLLLAESHVRDAPATAQESSVQAFVGVTMRHVVESLINLRRVTGGNAEGDAEVLAWTPSDSAGMREALREAIATLERTKTAFKSKELGELRRKLEGLLKS